MEPNQILYFAFSLIYLLYCMFEKVYKKIIVAAYRERFV